MKTNQSKIEEHIEELVKENIKLKRRIKNVTIICVTTIITLTAGFAYNAYKRNNAELERNLLSDSINSYVDKTNNDSILNEVSYFLETNNETLTDFSQWSYCY